MKMYYTFLTILILTIPFIACINKIPIIHTTPYTTITTTDTTKLTNHTYIPANTDTTTNITISSIYRSITLNCIINSNIPIQSLEIQRKHGRFAWEIIKCIPFAIPKHEFNCNFTESVNTAEIYTYRIKQVYDYANNKFMLSKEVHTATSLSNDDYKLSKNYPDPFNPSTKFQFALKHPGLTIVKIYNGLGQEIITPFNKIADANTVYTITFDATGLSSGTYLYILKTNDRFEVKKMLYLR